MAAPAGDAEHVILVHGLWMNGLEMWLLGRRLRACGFQVHRFSYRSTRESLAVVVPRLAAMVAALPAPRAHFVCHSLGGLLTRHLFHAHPELPLGRIVTLGTPHDGSQTARALARHRTGRALLGRGVEALLGQRPPWDPRRELGVIAGTRSLGLGRWITRLPLPNDGTVALAEAAAGEAADRVTIDVGHMGLLLSAEVAGQVCAFLRRGHFEHRAGDVTDV